MQECMVALGSRLSLRVLHTGIPFHFKEILSETDGFISTRQAFAHKTDCTWHLLPSLSAPYCHLSFNLKGVFLFSLQYWGLKSGPHIC
jgi:hypothetical protein